MKIINKAFFSDKWNIGYTKQNIGDLIDRKCLKSIQWLKEDKTDYSADPFVVSNNTSTSVYYEYFNFWEGKGKIYHIDNFDFKTKQRTEGLSRKSSHLSYPYLFKENENCYCIPETSDDNEVGLYTVNPENKLKFEKKCTLLSGRPYVDSSIIKYHGLYWLFTSLKRSKISYSFFILRV